MSHKSMTILMSALALFLSSCSNNDEITAEEAVQNMADQTNAALENYNATNQ